MRIRPSLLLVATALSAFFVAQTALGSPPEHAPDLEVRNLSWELFRHTADIGRCGLDAASLRRRPG